MDRDRGLGGEQAQQLLVALGQRRRAASFQPTAQHADACGRRWTTGTHAPDARAGQLVPAERDARVAGDVGHEGELAA